MPFKKKFGRRRFKKRKAGGWRNMKLGTVANKAYSGYKFLRSIVNVEKHFFDSNFSGTLGTAGGSFSADFLTQGDAYNNRAGNSILVKSLFITFALTVGATSPQVVRIVVYLDRENRAATPATLDVLESNTVEAPINHTNGSRFKILRDFRIHLNTTNHPTATPKCFIKLNHHAKYNDGNTGTSADFRENHLYYLMLCSNNSLGPTFATYSRLRYIDN